MSRTLRAHLVLFFVGRRLGIYLRPGQRRAARRPRPLLFNLLRMALAFSFLAVAYRHEWRKITPAGWRSGAIVGFFLAVAYHLQTSGLNLTTPANSAFLTGLTLVLVPIVSAPPSWSAWLGVGLAFTGVGLMTAPAAGGGMGRGDLLTLGCAVAFTCHILFQDRVSQKATSHAGWEPVPFKQLAMLQLGFCTLIMGITTPLMERPHIHFTPLVLVALAIESVFATALAFTVQSWVQQFLAPTNLVLIYVVEPVFAWLTSLLVLHQGLTVRAGCGALLILTGVLAAEFLAATPKAQSASE